MQESSRPLDGYPRHRAGCYLVAGVPVIALMLWGIIELVGWILRG